MLAKRNTLTQKREQQAAQQKLEQGRKRIKEIDALYARIYEDNAAGRISDERFAKLSATYESEQAELENSLAALEKQLAEANKATVDLHMLLKGLREFSEVRELTPTIVNTLIRRIEVHNNDKYDGHCHVKVDIYFTAVGMIDLPTEQELRKMMDEINEDSKSRRLSA
jgi:Ca2+-binding EF-hand superfamily protein